jgi:hypothetical protein
MLPLLFILIVTGLSISVSCLLSERITWLTYYMGTMSGLLISGVAIDLWNWVSRRREENKLKEKSKRGYI